MVSIKQLSLKNPTIQSYETYIITNDDFGKSFPIYVFLPFTQSYGKNPRWIQYSTTTKVFEPFLFTAKDLKEEIQKFRNFEDNKLKLYVMDMSWGEYLQFKLINESKLQSQLVNATTMRGCKTSVRNRAPVKKTVRKH